ncbi:TetR/AcrR family transcriptional regulator [Mumia zhuanghuii]|uniref:TetR/AcrR family transcriptional regulator n=2 Tax=Mumia TaxID=1546255 RepID=A0ABW1QFX9_9ACTN|nr:MULTISPECIES: TetR/AcrR family transcriptional regulator [Mumia]KAA1422864.1 TetR/AcrR family transcriptional regulator [Mumia zhuanghuii]
MDDAETPVAASSSPPSRDRFAPLWEPPPTSRRGRPPRVSRDQVVDAAVAIADADGLDAVSMRTVARSLDVGAMTLYSHVPGRDELVDAMVDRAYADLALPDADLSWRPALEQYAHGYWSLLRDHPWLLDLNTWRLPLAPHVFDAEEAAYRILLDTGLSGTRVVETVRIVNNTVAGFARAAAAEDADARAHGTDYASYWEASTDFWEHLFDPARYPSMTRLWSVGAFDSSSMPFDLHISGLLDTLELLIDRAQADGPAHIPTYEECMTHYDDRVADELHPPQP